MGVKSSFKAFFESRLVLGSGVAILSIAIFFIASSFTKHSDRDTRARQTNILVRQIGHQLLLEAGDEASRVMPVTETEEGKFVLSFEHKFVLNHDSLMAISKALLTKEQFPSGYTVTVHDCSEIAKIVYGFQISHDTPSILACRGRIEPRGCYIIEFVFPDFYESNNNSFALVGGGMLVGSFIALLIGRFGKNATPLHTQTAATKAAMAPIELATIGKFSFDVKKQCLMLGTEVITLTVKECKVLELLNANFGELTPRETLIQEVWISEGVITGRSLDMFISRLRRKLSGDPHLSITNVHGKGYKLASSQSS